jgi:hypothetical protein
MEGHSSRLEQAEDRISELEDEMEIKGKTEELVLKQLKTRERNMQELTDSFKRPNLRMMDMKKEKRCKQIQQNNNRKFPKSKEIDKLFSKVVYQFTFLPAVFKTSSFSISSPTPNIICF